MRRNTTDLETSADGATTTMATTTKNVLLVTVTAIDILIGGDTDHDQGRPMQRTKQEIDTAITIAAPDATIRTVPTPARVTDIRTLPTTTSEGDAEEKSRIVAETRMSVKAAQSHARSGKRKRCVRAKRLLR